MSFSFDDVPFSLKKPFINLTTRARVLQIFRLFTGLAGFIWVLVIMTGAFTQTDLYVNRLDCSHVDVANGLFSVLRESVSSSTNSLADNYGAGLSASQIELLGAYTEKNVEACPQYIQSNIYNWCFGDYNKTISTMENGSLQEKKTYVNEYCTKHDRNYVFDYRGELKTIGLNIILAYAYDDSSIKTTVSNNDYIPDADYVNLLEHRRRMSKTISSLSILSICTDFVVIVLAIIMYGSRGYAKDDSNVSQFYKLIIPILSLLSFISIFVAVISMTAMSISIRNEISNELGSFGISSHLGGLWFGMAWTSVILHFFNACAWGGPVWCGAPSTPIRIAEQDDIDYVGTPSFKQRPFKITRKNPDWDEGYSDDLEMQDNITESDPFKDVEDPFDDSNGSLEKDSSWAHIHATETESVPGSSVKNNIRGFLQKKNLKKAKKNHKKKESSIANDRRFTGFNEDEFIASDIFLTEDDRFILKRENLLLDQERKF